LPAAEAVSRSASFYECALRKTVTGRDAFRVDEVHTAKARPEVRERAGGSVCVHLGVRLQPILSKLSNASSVPLLYSAGCDFVLSPAPVCRVDESHSRSVEPVASENITATFHGGGSSATIPEGF